MATAKKTSVNYWKKYAEVMHRNGWPIVQLGYKSKKPLVNGWQSKDIKLSTVQAIAEKPVKYGIGIRCGNVIGIDNDYEKGVGVTAEFLAALEEITTHYFPDVLRRIGRPTRPALACFRLEEGKTYKSLNIHKLQIIGKGRQFVAYNIHPDTLKPYRWIDGPNPVDTYYTDLPAYSVEELEAFISAVEALQAAYSLGAEQGGTVLERIKAGEEVRPEDLIAPNQAALEKAAKYIKNDPDWGWEDWNNNIMMPLYNASEGEDWGCDLAHEISAQHDLYDFDATQERWDQIAKHPANQLGWPRLRWLAVQGGMPYEGPKEWAEWRLIDDQEKFYNIRTHAFQTTHWFNDVYPAQKQAGVPGKVQALTPTQVFVKAHPDQRYDRLTWNPYLKSGSVESRGVRLWNTWRAPDAFGKEGDVKPWLWIIRNVFKEKAELVIKRMAFDVQYPHLRPQWHIFVTGSQGVGKSDSFYPLMRWFSEWDLQKDVNSHTLKSEFNSYLSHTKMVIGEDVGGLTGAVFNEMKTVLAGGAQTIQVNEKNEKRKAAAIVASFYLAANNKNAISFSRLERRLLVHHSKAVSPQEDSSLKPDAIRRHEWLVKHWWNVIWYLKNKVDVDESYCSTLPDEYQEDLLETARMTAPIHERLAEYILDLIEDRQLFTIKWLLTELLNDDIGVDKNRVNDATVQAALVHLGCNRCNGGRQLKVMNGGMDYDQYRFWSRDRELQTAKPAILRQVWDARGFLDSEEEG